MFLYCQDLAEMTTHKIFYYHLFWIKIFFLFNLRNSRLNESKIYSKKVALKNLKVRKIYIDTQRVKMNPPFQVRCFSKCNFLLKRTLKESYTCQNKNDIGLFNSCTQRHWKNLAYWKNKISQWQHQNISLYMTNHKAFTSEHD